MPTAHNPAQTTAFDGADCRIFTCPPRKLAFYAEGNPNAWLSTTDAVDAREVR